MADRYNVDAKLAIVDEWVRSEFLAVTDALTVLPVTLEDESGPGRRFRYKGQTIVRLHPKQAHLGVGLPLALRDDVEVLTGALRSQRDAAWFNYSPQICDRDTLDALLDKSLHVAALDRTQRGQLPVDPPAGASTDDADLNLILAVIRAFRDHERATGAPSTVKVIREAIFFRWEAPRLPPGGKYSPLLPHSPGARARRSAGWTNGLVYEHVRPISLVIRDLLANPPATTGQLRSVLDAAADRVIITKEEDQAISAIGARNAIPVADDPWSRYRAAGLDPATFRALI